MDYMSSNNVWVRMCTRSNQNGKRSFVIHRKRETYSTELYWRVITPWGSLIDEILFCVLKVICVVPGVALDDKTKYNNNSFKS